MADEEIPQEEAQEPAPPPPPAVRMVVEDYDANNPDHYAQWLVSKKPDLVGYQVAFYEDLQPDGETYVRRPQPQPPEENPVTDVEKIFLTVSDRLNSDEAKRTGKSIDPKGAVPLSRAMAATAMLYGRWNYPTEADLSTGNNPAILADIYADPTTKTNAESGVEQKCKVLQFTLVMLAGQQFGLDYQAELGAYERTASGAFLSKLADDQRDWLKLPCPKMHKDWPEFESIVEMFQAVMK